MASTSGRYTNWNEYVARNHLNFLLNNLCSKEIVNYLWQGFDGKAIISERVKDEIENVLSRREANLKLLGYLLKAQRLPRFRRFIEVLRQSGSDYEVHEEVVNRLDRDQRLQDLIREVDSSNSSDEEDSLQSVFITPRNGKFI